MKTTTTIIAALLTVALSASASAQGLLDAICDDASRRGATATEAEYRDDPLAHADDFCALARFEPHKAAAQLGKMIRTTRGRENPNRFYFDPKRGADSGTYIQLLRPWMQEQNETGEWKWRIFQRTLYGAALADYDRSDVPHEHPINLDRLVRLGRPTPVPYGHHPLVPRHRIYAVNMFIQTEHLGPCNFRSLEIVEGSVVRQSSDSVMSHCWLGL